MFVSCKADSFCFVKHGELAYHCHHGKKDTRSFEALREQEKEVVHSSHAKRSILCGHDVR